ncbi:MAG TPA: hypothetical protein VG455_04230 [Acidimicrobiales bacterium]|nr:hypothetical protein [Acidimicrobiales bacterium]
MRLDLPYPDVRQDLNRWLPLIKWFLAIPHYVVLFFLDIAIAVVVHNRVLGYAFLLVTDRYPCA